MKIGKKLTVGLLAATFTFAGGFSSVYAAGGNAHTPNKVHHPFKVKSNASSTYQYGYNPAQIRNAYGINSLSEDGSGQTIAIVDAYGSPSIQSDLQTFDSQFGLPAADLTVAYPDGQPRSNGGWALETSMDVEWAHSVAPQAKILLVVAASNSLTDLLSAEDYATNHGAQVVSNSWGSSEFSSESSDESHFNHSGVAYTASSGDNGSGVEWPAASKNVIGVGGTTLNLDSYGDRLSVSGWSGSGGGTSSYFSRPSYQDNWTSVVGSSRGVPDIAFDADPNTGVAVYDTTRYQGQAGWWQVGGTSLGAPCWAGLIALVDSGSSSPLSSTQALDKIYSLAGTTGSSGYNTNFYDVTSGNNGGYYAQSGYDLVTGIGEPQANNLVPNMEQ